MGITLKELQKAGFHPHSSGSIQQLGATLEHYASDAKQIRLYRHSELDPEGDEDTWTLYVKK